MAAPKTKTPNERLLLKARVGELMNRGYRGADIAREIGITPAGAQHWIDKIRAEIAAEYQRSIESLTALAGAHVAELDAVKREAWSAWEASKRPARVVIHREESGGEKGERTVTERRREQRLPDARYLSAILAAQAQQAKIVGVNAPEKVAPTSPDGLREYGELTDEERASRITALLDRARAARARQTASDGAGATSGASEMDSGERDDN